MRGGRVGFYRKPCTPRAAPSCAAHVTVLRELWYCHVAVLVFHPRQQPLLLESSSISRARTLFYPIFGGSFGGLLELKMGHAAYRRKALSTSSFQRYKVCANRSSDEGVMAPGSRGIGAVFVHSSGEDSDQTGDAFGEPRVPRRSRSHYLSNAPGLAGSTCCEQERLCARRRLLRCLFLQGSGFAGIRAWTLVRYGPASRVHRGVFGPFEGSFPIRIPADPDKFLAIREFHVVHGCVLFPMCPGSQINLLRVRKTLCASAATSVGKFRKFQHSLISSACFHARGRRSSRCRISDDLVLATTLSFLVRFRPVKYGIEALDILSIPWSRGGQFDPVFGLVNGPVKPWSNLVNLGQTWSNLVKALQTLGNVSRTSFQGFLGKLPLLCSAFLGTRNVGQRINDSIFARSDFLGLRVLLRLSRSSSRFACQSFRSPNGHSRAWRRSVGMRKDDSGLEMVKRGSFGNSRMTIMVARGPTTSGPARPFPFILTPLRPLLISCYPGIDSSPTRSTRLRSTISFRLYVLQSHNDLCLSRNGDESGRSAWVTTQVSKRNRGSGSGGHRRSDRLAKGKAVAYAPESSPDTDDEYDAMEDVRTRVDASLARDLQAEFDAEAAGSAPSAARAPPRPGVVIGRSAGPSETTRPSPQPSVTTGSSDAPPAAPRRAHTRSTGILPSRLKRQRSEGIPDSAGTIPEDYVAPGFRYPPHGGIRPRYPVAVEISDTPLLTNLLAHPSSLVRRCQEPPYSAGRGGWSEFSRLLAVSRPEYREFLIGLGFGPFLSIPYVTCEMAVLPVDWSAILGIRFGGRAPPSEPIDGFEAREILGLADHDATEGTRRPSVRIRYLADVLRRDREEPPTELRYRQWAAYFIFSCFLGNDRSIVPTPIVGMFRDIDTLRDRSAFLASWQFTVFWAFEHFPTFAPSRLPLASDPDFPLARRWDTSRIERMTTCTLLELRMTVDCLRDADIIFQPYSAALSQRPEVFRAVALSRLRLWIRTTRSWELLLGVSAYPSLVREGVPYQEWFEQVSLGSLMSLHEVEGGRVMGGVAMDSHHIRSSGQIERLEGRDGQTEATRREGEMVQMQRDLAQSQRDLGSRDAEVARLAAAVRRLEDQLHGMGITPVTGADLSGPGQPSSSPPRDPVSRDWFFDDPSPP
uniref:Aminotransferase-like plant mobile domain-containing protein n=1 Tax=Fagus sylvatica TaxID=28930 RepID=A0A2N9HC15_FAGSY